MVRTKNRVALCIGLLVFNIVFIWGNSLLPAEISSKISGFVRDLLQSVVGGSGEETLIQGDGWLRKLAHFSEFTCLGALWCWLVGMYSGRNLWKPLVLGLGVACVDECIQIFVPGRGPRVTDVGIDFLGVCLGAYILYRVSAWLQERRKQK